MQSGFTGHVTPSEWRWVLTASILLVGLAFIPFLWVFLSNAPDSGWQFMGALHGHIEASAYLSRIRQGMEGNLLVEFLHTPEHHEGIIFQLIYPLLGQVSRLASDSLSPILVFHVARVSVTVFMYLALYQLAATIWMRIRTRRIFFVLVAVGSGLGWVVVVLTGGQTPSQLPIDMILPQISPFFAGLVSVHTPLTIACLALLVAIFVEALRPGIEDSPSVRNKGALAFALGIVLVLLYPEAYVLFALVSIITVAIGWYFARRMTQRELLWLMWSLVPALPILIYDILIIRSNPFVMEWIDQRTFQTINIVQLLVGLGGMLIFGLPSIIRALRRFESDGDRFMIVWLFVGCIGAILPLVIQAHFLVGIMIPLAYFASRSIEDVWIKRIHRLYRRRLFAVLALLLMISNLFALIVPVIPLGSRNPTNSSGLVVSSEYRAALEWLGRQNLRGQVVMASPEIGIWIPAWLGAKTVGVHPTETMDAGVKADMIAEWYQMSAEDECVQSLIRINGFQERYSVNFVIYGSLEARFGEGDCLESLIFVANFGDVEIYQLPAVLPR